jgi:hypothetical protein
LPASAVAAKPRTVFPSWELRNFVTFIGSYRQHKEALKYFREELENTSQPFDSPCLVFPDDCSVGRPRRSDTDLDAWSWSWKEMVSQLDVRSMQIVVQGEDGRNGGPVGCYIAPRPRSHDRKRCEKLKREGRALLDVRLPVWDFVIRRAYGTDRRLHPRRSTWKVETWIAEAYEFQPQGHGWSWGPQAYWCNTNVKPGPVLHFDVAKGLLRPSSYALSAQKRDRSCGLCLLSGAFRKEQRRQVWMLRQCWSRAMLVSGHRECRGKTT